MALMTWVALGVLLWCAVSVGAAGAYVWLRRRRGPAVEPPEVTTRTDDPFGTGPLRLWLAELPRPADDPTRAAGAPGPHAPAG